MVNSRRKGSKNERGLAKDLELWTGFEFVRVPQSGGLRWASGMMVTGDVIPADPLTLANFPFSIEAKVKNDVNFRDPLINQSDIEKFYAQSVKDANRVKKIPLVMFRMDRMKRGLYFVILPHTIFRKLKSVITLEGNIPYYVFSNIFTIFTSDHLFSVPYIKVAKILEKSKHVLFTDSYSN